MVDTVESLREEYAERLEAIPPADQYAQLIAGLQALGFGTPAMQTFLDGLADMRAFISQTDPSLNAIYTYANGVVTGGRPLQDMCTVVEAPPPIGGTVAMRML
jgi:hypothetical protein